MDFDEEAGQGPNQPPAGNDIETSFLQQFSCLGTTDHDELVSQLQKLIGNQLNYNTARFFLDMNNWNLQGAVGCYFDCFNSGLTVPSMNFISDVTVGLGEDITPNSRYVQSWKVMNNGEEMWPSGCYLQCVSHPIQDSVVNIPVLSPNESGVITIELSSPDTCGSYLLKFRLCTANGTHFGPLLQAEMTVSDAGTLAITQQVSSMRTNDPGQSSNTLAMEVYRPPPPPSGNQMDDEMWP